MRRLYYVAQALDSQDPVKDMYEKNIHFRRLLKFFHSFVFSVLYIIFNGPNLSLALQSRNGKTADPMSDKKLKFSVERSL